MKQLICKAFMFSVALVILFSCKKEMNLTDHNGKDSEGNLNTKSAGNWDALIDREIAYIKSCQLTASGAIMNVPFPGNKINPYFANIACIAILERPTTSNLAVVKSWMAWYLRNINLTAELVNGKPEVIGSIYDYYDDGAEPYITDKKYDSVDSYSATFLKLAKRLGEVSPADLAWLAINTTNINLIADAMEMCIDNSSHDTNLGFSPDDNDGLTIDSYAHGAKYLMDNAEVNEGFKAMVWLRNNGITGAKSVSHYQTLLDVHSNAMETQFWKATVYDWNDDGGYYARSQGCNDPVTCSNIRPNIFYADGDCQLYPALLGIILPTSARATSLYSTFNTNYPYWHEGPNNTAPTRYDAAGFAHTEIVYAAAKMGDVVRANKYLTHVESFSNEPNLWYVLEAGFTILAASQIMNPGGIIPPPVIPPSTINLALNKPASASSMSSSAYNSNDGNMTTRWSSDAANNQWWKVDLVTTQEISKVVIEWEGAYDTGYSIETSTDNITFTNAFTTTTGNGGNDEIIFTSRNARYVRIQCTTRVQTLWGSSFWEFSVYSGTTTPPNPPPGTVNLALNKTASASSMSSSAYNSNDGNMSTRWSSDVANNQWWKVDLGSAQEISKVVIEWEGAYDTGYSIETSTDNITFTNAFTTTIGNGGNDEIIFTSRNARYVRIQCTTRVQPLWGSSFWEFQIF